MVGASILCRDIQIGAGQPALPDGGTDVLFVAVNCSTISEMTCPVGLTTLTLSGVDVCETDPECLFDVARCILPGQHRSCSKGDSWELSTTGG